MRLIALTWPSMVARRAPRACCCFTLPIVPPPLGEGCRSAAGLGGRAQRPRDRMDEVDVVQRLILDGIQAKLCGDERRDPRAFGGRELCLTRDELADQALRFTRHSAR